jgi:hypothetical protein
MLSPFDSFIYFSIYLVFIFSCRESLLSLTRELRRVEDSTTSHDGRWLQYWDELSLVACQSYLFPAYTGCFSRRTRRNGYLSRICLSYLWKKGRFRIRTATLDDCLHGHPFSGIDLFPAYADCYSRRMLVQMTARWTVWLRPWVLSLASYIRVVRRAWLPALSCVSFDFDWASHDYLDDVVASSPSYGGGGLKCNYH